MDVTASSFAMVLVPGILLMGVLFAIVLVTKRRRSSLKIDAKQGEATQDLSRDEKSTGFTEERYRKLVYTARDVVFTLNLDGIITSLNPWFETFTGWSRSEWLGRPYEELIVEEDRARARERFENILQGKRFRALRMHVRTRTSRTMVVEVNVAPQMDGGMVVGLLGIVRDVTREQIAEDALKASEQRFRAMIEKSTDGIGLLSADGKVTYASPALSEILGYTAEEIVGCSSFDFLHPDDRQFIIRKFTRMLESPGMIDTTIFRSLHQDGSWRWIEATVTNQLDEPYVRAIVINYKDITQSKIAEQTLQRQLGEMSVLNAVAKAGALSKNIDELIERVTDTLGKVLYPDNCGVLLVDENQETWKPHPSYLGISAEELGKAYPFSRGICGKAILSGATNRVGDIHKDDAYLAYTSGIQSEVAVPIMVNGKIFGCLNAESRELDGFSEDDERLMNTIARSMSTAIEKILLLQAEKRRREELQSMVLIQANLLEASMAVTSNLEVDSVLHKIVETICTTVKADRSNVLLINERGFCFKWIGSDDSFNFPPHFIRPGGISAKVIKSGEGIFVSTPGGPNTLNPGMVEEGIQSAACLPLHSRTSTFGVIWVNFKTLHKFSLQEQDVMQAFAGHASIAIENAGLFEAEQRRAQETSAIAEVGREISETLQLDVVLERIASYAKELIQAETSAVYLLDPPGQTLHAVAVIGMDTEEVRQDFLQMGEGILGAIAANRSGEIANNTAEDPRAVTIQGTEVRPFEHLMGVPVMLKDDLTGLIAVWRNGAGQEFKTADLDFLNSLSRQVSVAIENARLFEATQKRLREIEAVYTVSTALRSAQTLEESMPIILDQLMSLLNARAASLELVDPSTGEIVVELAHGEWSWATGTRTPQGEGITRHVIETIQPFVTADVLSDEKMIRPDLFSGINAVACVPVIAQHQPIGGLWIGRCTPIHSEEVSLLAAIGEMVGNAIHRMKLHEQTEHLLIDLQVANRDLSLAYDTTLEGWAKALELRDKETEGHSRRVMILALQLACRMGISEPELTHFRRGILLHDIGKMGIRDHLLRKKSSLTPEEWNEMRKHPQYAYDLLHSIAYLRPALDIPYCHHEKWDGTGYPRGLRGKDIPLSARIFTIVDVYDALSNDRPYRSAWPRRQVMQYLREQSGIYFDPEVVNAFAELLNEDAIGPKIEIRS